MVKPQINSPWKKGDEKEKVRSSEVGRLQVVLSGSKQMCLAKVKIFKPVKLD